MMKKSLLSIFFALFAISLTFGQYSSAQYLKAANKSIEKRKFFSAMINYSKAIELGETSPEIKYNYGLSAYHAHSYGLAESALEDYLSTDEGVDAASAMLTLAEVKQTIGKYDQAQKYFDLYLAEYSDLDPVATSKAKRGKKSTGWAMKQTELKGIEIQHLKREVNSDLADVSPVMHGDKLYYSTNRFSIGDKGKQYYGQIVTKGGEPLPVTASFNTVSAGKLTVSPSFNKDGSLMFYSLCELTNDENATCKLYYSKKEGKNYGGGKLLPSSINMDGYSSTQPSLVSEGDGSYTLYFASTNPGGKGGYDIWKTTMNSEMDFTAPMAVKAVNTVGDDKSPFYHVGSQTLYFNSNGRSQGFGDRDLYKASNAGGSFSAVSNLGAPFNSSFGDRYLWLNEAGDEAYFVSNREGSYYSDESFETCCYDIYRADIALECEMIVNVKDCNSGIPLGGNVSIKDVKSGEVIYSGPLSGAGTASATINRNNEYEITVENECYPSKTMNAGPFPDADAEDCTTNVDMCLEGEMAKLEACSFDKKTSKELNGSEICLLDVATGEQDCKKTSPGNCVTFDVLIGKEYKLVGKKATYIDESLICHADCKDLKKNLYLGKRPVTCMETSFPISLYFDNDEPNPRSRKTT